MTQPSMDMTKSLNIKNVNAVHSYVVKVVKAWDNKRLSRNTCVPSSSFGGWALCPGHRE